MNLQVNFAFKWCSCLKKQQHLNSFPSGPMLNCSFVDDRFQSSINTNMKICRGLSNDYLKNVWVYSDFQVLRKKYLIIFSQTHMLQLDFMVALIFDFLVQIKKNVKEHPIIIRVQFGFYQVYVFQEIPFLHFPYDSMLKHIVTPQLPTQSYERQKITYF